MLKNKFIILYLPETYKFTCIFFSKIVELEEELRVVGNNLKSLELNEEKVPHKTNQLSNVIHINV